MNVNGINIKKYNAKVLTIDIQPSTFNNNDNWSRGMLTPFMSDSDLSYKSIKVEVKIKDSNRDNIDNHISNLLKNFVKPSIVEFEKYSNHFKVKLDKSTINKTKYKGCSTLTLELYGYEYKDEITVSSTSKTIDIDNVGTETTPAYVEILSTIDQIDMTLTGLTDIPIPFKNLHANQVIIIDPENGTITEGVSKTNKFGDIDIWEFPRLKPGVNHITFNRDNVTVKIKYKPRFI